MIRYPLASSSWDEAERKAIESVMDSGMYTMGSVTAQFELTFSRFVGSKYGVMVNSGSSANLLAVAALFYTNAGSLAEGDEVIVPAVSWATTYYPLYQYGLKLKFVDIDRDTLNYNLAALKEAVTEQTRMIVIVNLLGNPNDFHAIKKIAGTRSIILLEDNCESLGAIFDGKQAGTFGVIGTFSFFFSHHMSTMEGGMIITDDEELYHILLSLRAHGWTRNLPKLNRVCGMKSDDPFEESFRFVLPGYNVRPMEINAAVGLEQLKKLPEFLRVRRENAALFRQRLKDHPWFTLQQEIGSSSWFGFSMLLKKEAPIDRTTVVSFLRQNGIECRPIVAGNFTGNAVVKRFNYEIHGQLEHADFIDRNGFFVGNHHFNIEEQIGELHRLLDRLEEGGET
ncbi:DegT/DnrJ/EryC1/StrS family aminotransferase [Paenibacillus alkaliterrae]|uniref:DegT/DnrJ/EryC1/StrS family aminotransferase n=1 Tax=Paenibacillus alkaliterrae TaxID=320909 RepID=UPI001F300277|nr:DegT/DnrJ/EryC1/StrS family aminotransferase [Paenibacillus alkaliterrae]MCF2940158.1 DegT/DnrJ/EryC1/StrS family aminotransferase [Paenibacillus alkaliterrae]